MDEGLDRVDDLEIGSGFADFRLAITPEAIAARAEIGHRIDETWSAFAFGEAESSWGRAWGASAGIGIRGRW